MSLDVALKFPFPSRPPSRPLPDVVMAQTRITAQKILQMSYMELLQEGIRPEPRLRRLLGHVTTYENANQWCLENRRECIFYTSDKQEKAGDKRATTNDNGRDGLSSKLPTQVQCFPNLSEFQMAMQSQVRGRTLVTVNATEVGADSDDSDSSDSSDDGVSGDSSDESVSGDSSDESYEGDSHDHDDHHDNDNDPRVCSHNSDAGMKRVEYMTNTLSLKVGANNKATDTSMYRSVKGEQDDDRKIWEQQPRVFTSSESKWAYNDMWL
jgi:hypothetical protein